MTEHKFTDEEIIKLVRAYAERECGKCNVKDLGICCGSCFIGAIKEALDLINRQKAEVERLREKQVEDEKLLNDRVIESVNAVSQAHLKYENALEEQIKTATDYYIHNFEELLAL